MAHEMTHRDTALYVGKPAWHGLGTVIQRPDGDGIVDPLKALDLVGIEPEVETAPVYFQRESLGLDKDGMPTVEQSMVRAERWQATLNPKTGEVYGIVGKDYVPTDPGTICRLAIEAGAGDVETIGTFRSGAVFYLLVRLGSTFAVHGDKDEIMPYGLLTTAHDGTAGLQVTPTDIRVVCANTHGWALSKAERAMLLCNFRHTSGIMGRVNEIRDVLKRGRKYAERMQREAEAMAARRMSDAEVGTFFANVYQAQYGEVPSGARHTMTKGEKAKATRASDMIATWVQTLRTEQEYLGLSDPTVYLTANAVTAWSDHARPVRASSRGPADRGFSNTLGSGAAFKQGVFEKARELLTTGAA